LTYVRFFIFCKSSVKAIKFLEYTYPRRNKQDAPVPPFFMICVSLGFHCSDLYY